MREGDGCGESWGITMGMEMGEEKDGGGLMKKGKAVNFSQIIDGNNVFEDIRVKIVRDADSFS